MKVDEAKLRRLQEITNAMFEDFLHLRHLIRIEKRYGLAFVTESGLVIKT